MGLIISLIINIVAPGIGNDICTELISQLPASVGNCGCDVSLGGFLVPTVEYEAMCTFSGCDFSIEGDGGAFDLLLGGSYPLEIDADCEIPGQGDLSIDVDGSISVDSIGLTGCDIDFNPSSGSSIDCTCQFGCDGNGLSAIFTCPGYFTSDCINVITLVDEFEQIAM